MGIPAPAGVGASGTPDLGDQANAVLQGFLTAVGPTQPFAFRGPMNLAIWCSINTALTTTLGSLTVSVGSGTGLAAGVAVNSVNVPRGAVLASTSAILLPEVTLLGSVNTADALVRGMASTDGLLGATVTVPSTAEQTTIPAATTVAAIIQAAVAPTNLGPGVPGIIQLSAIPTQSPVQPVQSALTFARTGNAILVSGADAAATFTGAAISFSGTVQVERSFDGGATWIVCNVGGSGQLAQYTGTTVTPISLTFGEPEKNVLYRLNLTVLNSFVGTDTARLNYRISQTGGAAESLAIGPLSGG